MILCIDRRLEHLQDTFVDPVEDSLEFNPISDAGMQPLTNTSWRASPAQQVPPSALRRMQSRIILDNR